MAEKKSRGHDRTRVWTAVVYPESAPSDWRDLLDQHHIEWAESPLHDKDVNEATGEVKKPHWHIVLAFDGPKSDEQIAEILQPLNCPIAQKCHSLKGCVRYFAHLDNPDKFQYDPADIVPHGGFDVAAALAPNSAKRYSLIAEMMTYCRENGVTEFQDICDYALENRLEDWFPLLCDSCAMVMSNYIKSQRHRAEAAPRGKALAARGAAAEQKEGGADA